MPSEFFGDETERHRITRFRAALPPQIGACIPTDVPLTFDAAIVMVLHACGLKAPEHLEVVIVVSRLGVVAAESQHTEPGSFREYPMDLPPFDYEHRKP
jgi:hypothetical protein